MPINPTYFNTSTVISSQFQQDVALFTPDIAEYILQNHHGTNRPMSQISINQYRDDILAGVWTFAADPIRFDTNGHLIDGQHRMAALVAAGKQNPNIILMFTIATGLDPSTIKAIDQGRKRTAGQQLAITGGVKNYNAVAAGAKFAYLYETEGLNANSHRRKISAPIIEQWVDQNRAIVNHVNGHYHKIRGTDIPNGAATAAALILAKIDPDEEEDFFTILYEGGAAKDSPITTLDKRMARLRRQGVYQHPEANIYMVFKAWNAWRKGKTMTRLNRMSDNDQFPQPI